MHYETERKVALDAVRKAARLCQAVQAGIRPETLEKKDRSPVTVADFGSQAVVCSSIDAHFSDDPIIGEENAAMLRDEANRPVLDRIVRHFRTFMADASPEDVLRLIDRGNSRGHHDRFWTLDPIDGTKGFLRGDQYAVALALVVAGEVVVAALACPNLSDDSGNVGLAFVASKGSGAEALPLVGDGEAKGIRVSDVAEAGKVRFCESVESGHSSHGDAAAVADALGITQDSFRIDSQAKYAVVARGDADIYMRLPTRADYVEKIWDHAAGMLVVQEAGGRVTDVEGRPLDFTHGGQLSENTGVVATNGLVHDKVLKALREVGVT